MRFRFPYIILFLFSTARFFCQDIIVKKDSSRIEAKLLVISQTEVKYKLFSYPEGPLYVVSKSDIAYIVYPNGSKDVFNEIKGTETAKADSFYYANSIVWKGDTTKSKRYREPTIGDYIKFNLQAGTVINNAYSNFTRRDPRPSHTSGEEYSGNNDEKYFTNLNVGFNFLFGNSPYIKHIIGINYLRSKGEFKYDYYSAGSDGGHGGYTNSHTNFQYKSTVDFINVVTGIRFAVGKHLSIEPQVAFNYVAQTDERITGSITSSTVSGGPYPYTTISNTEYFNNIKSNVYQKKIHHTISFCPKLSYEFKIKQQAIGIYFSYNMALQYRLPWYLCGITYYPFKKLSPGIDNEKIRLFTNIKINTEIGLTLNNSVTNIPNRSNVSSSYEYDEFKAANKNIQTGVNLGINLIGGNNPYCKFILGFTYVQSKAEFIRISSDQYFDADKLYRHRRDLNIKSTNNILNFGTGMRFVLFNHLNIDNSLVVNIPLLSTNKYDGFEYHQEYTYSGTSMNGTYYQTYYSSGKVNASKSSELLYKYSLSYAPKISFDFKIKEQISGIYYAFNAGITQEIQWHVIGLTYYPFKKLR